ncbi:hypothetical protein A2635_04080 [Candidatus Peribacteria bacterium RIFCSPHIGHO2_01_FULL_51_9]|nr:MAG: hypothetical protein A2635_04080 [Candidatus Peribacteria bacterium RIFCSPHIGHO2_01_FULL_51_9]
MITEESIGFYESPIGWIEIRGTDTGISKVSFIEGTPKNAKMSPIVEECLDQMAEYFSGKRRVFQSFALLFRSTDFQRAVWDAVSEVGFGETASYADIARFLAKDRAVQAVGNAVGANPLAIIVPCHRILPKGGGTGEYAWGRKKKEWLLMHEKHSL